MSELGIRPVLGIRVQAHLLSRFSSPVFLNYPFGSKEASFGLHRQSEGFPKLGTLNLSCFFRFEGFRSVGCKGGFRGLGLRGLGCRGSGIEGSRFSVSVFGFRASGFGCRVSG